MLQSSAFASPPIPLSQYPKNENCRKEKEQINGRQCRESNVDHGTGGLGAARAGAATSFPQSTVAIPQVSTDVSSVVGGALESNRALTKYWRACSSRAASPEEFRAKQCRTTPIGLTAIRDRMACGVSLLEAVKWEVASRAGPNAESSSENEIRVGTLPKCGGGSGRGDGTGPGG